MLLQHTSCYHLTRSTPIEYKPSLDPQATDLEQGEPYLAINNLASDVNADLIVMGTYGRKGITRLLMGSVTERVVGYSKCPVMVSP